MKIRVIIIIAFLGSAKAKAYGQSNLKTDLAPNIGYYFSYNKTGLIKKNLADVGLNSFFRWEKSKQSLDYNILISLNYPLPTIDSSRTFIFLGLMPGFRKRLNEHNFIYINFGILSDLEFRRNSGVVKIGYSKMLFQNGHLGFNISNSTIGFINTQVFYLFTL